MIIVKQNKDIVNFSRVAEIKIVDYEAQKKIMENTLLDILTPLVKETTGIDYKKLNGYGIYAYTEKDHFTILGEYKTEERARKVLKEILEHYDSLKTNIVYSISDKDYPIDMKSYYEMPED